MVEEPSGDLSREIEAKFKDALVKALDDVRKMTNGSQGEFRQATHRPWSLVRRSGQEGAYQPNSEQTHDQGKDCGAKCGLGYPE